MGLFSVLTESKSTIGNAKNAGAATSSGSISIPTVVQLYTGDAPIRLDETSVLTGFSALTYQAIQVGSQEEEEVKNRHQTPDLGVWNCHVQSQSHVRSTTKKEELVDSLLATVATKVRVFCLTVDLSQPNQVEPSLTLLQTALVRHLIEHPPSQQRKTATTSLYQLQTTEFGKAVAVNQDEEAKHTATAVNESFRSIYTTLIICAILPTLDSSDDGDGDADTYKAKQAQALVIYHLRKFAAALNCCLCFVGCPSVPSSSTNVAAATAAATSTDTGSSKESSSSSSLQPTADYNTLSRWWRDLALDQAIWESTTTNNGENLPLSNSVVGQDENVEKEQGGTSTEVEEAVTPEMVEVATPLYGPGKYQEDLIESVLLRGASYPGHWDATKDSLWVALPASKDSTSNDDAATAAGTNANAAGDEGWLGQLRQSIASAQDLPPSGAISSPDKQSQEGQKDGKDAEVTDFFASLLKKP